MRNTLAVLIGVWALTISGTGCDVQNPMPSPSPSPSPSPTPQPQTMSVDLGASKDGTLYQHPKGILANGAGVGMIAGRNGQMENSIRRAILAFDLSEIPAGSTITSVVLTLNVSRANDATQMITLHSVMADWGEGTSSVGSGSGGGQGGGTAATENDVTWLHTFFDSTFWINAGGDFADQESASTEVGSDGAYTWGSTDAMVSDVQSWLDDSSQNFGWLLRGNESVGGTTKVFETRESDEALRPMLTVEYTSPAADPCAADAQQCRRNDSDE